jgi:predicted kinase
VETKKLIICRGIQGSGKSTWAKQWCHEDPENRIRFNNDDIRNMLGDYWVPNREKVVTATYNTVLAYSMEKGYNIVVDNMNLNPKTCAELEKMVKDFNENYTYDWKYEIEYKDFWIPVDECVRRDAKREHPIGEKVIRQTWRRYKDFIIHEEIMAAKARTLIQDTNLPAAIIVDMDATLCLNTSGRPYYGEGAAEGMLDDVAIEGTCALVRRMYEKCKVFIVTGREGTPEIIAATKKWLAMHDIAVDELFFRPVKDYSPGADCKKKIYKDNIEGKYNVQFVLEDNYKCVKMWREQGLLCLQPNEGKF